VIEAEGLRVQFDSFTAIAGIDLSVDRGEFVTVIGPSGCGKTTLLRTIGGLEEPSAGVVRIDGNPPGDARTAANVGFVFQEHALLPWKSALRNVTFLRRMAGRDPEPQRATDVLSAVGLEGFEDAKPSELSGGMKQRVAIARAVHLGSPVLLMDEPFGELDELTRDELAVEVRRIWRTYEKTVVFVTHSVPEAVLLGDRCVVMDGRPGTIAGTHEIDLPRPRDREVFESERFHRETARVRALLHHET
jgi:NitT/TauT family transport system ATP-binding protein